MMRDIVRRIEARSRALVWNARRGRRSIRRGAGLADKARLLWLYVAYSVLPEREHPAARTAVTVHDDRYGQDVWLRPRSSDLAAFDFVDTLHHLPPEIDPPLDHIAVLGANIGLLLIDFAARYPAARLLAVEPDPENAALARRNVAPLGDRCTFVEAAVWYEDAELELSWTRDAWGFNLARNVTAEERARGTHVVRAVEVGALFDAFTAGQPVDYVFVNIESAWYELLRHGTWADNVRSLKIEIVDHFDEAVPMLQSLGYQAHLDRLSWGAYAVGIRA
jgi:FkbM family methyltransferase